MISQDELTGRIAAVRAIRELSTLLPSLSAADLVTLALLGGAGLSNARIARATFTRPSDTISYATNDIISNSTSATTPIEFLGSTGSQGGSGIISSARLTTNKTTITASGSAIAFRLVIYIAAPANPPVDNAAFLASWANTAVRIGAIDFNFGIAGTDCAEWEGIISTSSGEIPFVLPAGTSLFGLLQYIGVGNYAPDSQQQFTIQLGIR